MSRDFLPGSTWVYGPVEKPTYVRLIARQGGLFWKAMVGGKSVLFIPERHPDIREAEVVKTTERYEAGHTIVESYLLDPLSKNAQGVES